MVVKGLLNKGKFDQIEPTNTIVKTHFELNKVRGIKGKDEVNTTLPMNYERIESISILDIGVGINIATKTIGEKW